MRRRVIKRKLFSVLFVFFMVSVFSILSSPIKAEASWINREQSGIYYEDSGGGLGQGIGQLDEDENAEEVIVDEGSGFFLELINTILCWLLSTIGRTLFGLLDLVGASLDQLIYGRLVASNTLFTFDLGKDNIYGIVSSAVYGILSSGIIALLIPVFMGKVVLSAWKKGDLAMSGLKDAFGFFVLSLLLIVLMPYFLDVMLFIRDSLLYVIGTDGASSLFGSGSATSIIAVLSESANENIISGVVFVAAVMLNLYFLIGYVGIALSMTANFILFPMVVIKTAFDKQVLKNWLWEMVSCMSVPIVDAVLIMIPSFLGMYASQLTTLDAIGVAVVQLIICYLIIPIRSYSRGILGLRTNPLESSGLAAASFMGMAAARGIKNAFSESRDAKKNAELDRQRAEQEEDLAELEREETAGGYGRQYEANEGKMPSTDEIQRMINKKNGIDPLEKDEEPEENPLGELQSYAGELESHISSHDEEDDIPLPKEAFLSQEEKESQKKRLQELEGELQDAYDRKNSYEGERVGVLSDDSLDTLEKAEKIKDLDKAILDENETIDGLEKEREALLSVDDKIRLANQKKASLEEQYHNTSKEAGLDPTTKENRLEAINDEIKAVDEEISFLQRQKQKMQIANEKEALEKEPATLRQEYANLKDSCEKLNLEREDLIRQRERLASRQGDFLVGSAEHERFSEEIKGIDQKIGKIDQEIGNNVAEQNMISGALSKQNFRLRDMQAYNLHERVKAQDAYEASKSKVAEIEQMLSDADAKKVPYLADGTVGRRKLENDLKEAKSDMKKARDRLGSLSMEDRRVAARLQEISPDFNQFTESDLKEVKQAQNVKRAKLQKEIAGVREEMEMDPENKQYYRSQIAKLQSEVADCNYQNARIDQILCMMDGGKGAKGRKNFGGEGFSSDVGSEYERKRAAIMERYANVDNFERPEFSGISRERKAALYRERAMRTQQVLNQKRLAGVAGAAVGGTLGIWLGSTGVASGTIIGAAVGSELGTDRGLRMMEKVRIKPVDYSKNPLDFHIASDLRDNTREGTVRTIQRVRSELMDSLQSERFQSAVEEELVKNNLIKTEIKSLFKKHNITKDNYSSKRDQLLKELEGATYRTMENAEIRIVEKCAGEEYAKLSDQVKRSIVEEVAKPNMDVFKDLCESQYLCKTWQPHYEDYFDD